MRSLVVLTAILAQIACQWAAMPHCHASQDPDHHERPHVHLGHGHHHHAPHHSPVSPSLSDHLDHDDTCIFLAPAVVAVARNGAERPTTWQADAVDALVATASPVIEVASSAPQPPRDVGLVPPLDLVIFLRTLRI